MSFIEGETEIETKTCCICTKDLTELNQMDRLEHINECLDRELDKKIQEAESASTQKYEPPAIETKIEDLEYDYTGMPDYERMPATEVKKHLDEYGMKKTLDTKFARTVLKETWLYAHQGIFPPCLSKFL